MDIWKQAKQQWHCTVCLSGNPLDVNACRACEEPRPGSSGKAASTTTNESKVLKPSTAASASAPFKFGVGATSASSSKSAATPFKFGGSSQQSQPTTSSGFHFGSSAKTSNASTSTFKFGASSTPTEAKILDTSKPLPNTDKDEEKPSDSSYCREENDDVSQAEEHQSDEISSKISLDDSHSENDKTEASKKEEQKPNVVSSNVEDGSSSPIGTRTRKGHLQKKSEEPASPRKGLRSKGKEANVRKADHDTCNEDCANATRKRAKHTS